jgi:hypothetical protein
MDQFAPHLSDDVARIGIEDSPTLLNCTRIPFIRREQENQVIGQLTTPGLTSNEPAKFGLFLCDTGLIDRVRAGGSCRASCPCQALSASRNKDQACCRCICSRQLSQRTSSLNWSKTSRGLGWPHRSHGLSGGSTSIRSGSFIDGVLPWSPIASSQFLWPDSGLVRTDDAIRSLSGSGGMHLAQYAR